MPVEKPVVPVQRCTSEPRASVHRMYPVGISGSTYPSPAPCTCALTGRIYTCAIRAGFRLPRRCYPTPWLATGAGFRLPLDSRAAFRSETPGVSLRVGITFRRHLILPPDPAPSLGDLGDLGLLRHLGDPGPPESRGGGGVFLPPHVRRAVRVRQVMHEAGRRV